MSGPNIDEVVASVTRALYEYRWKLVSERTRQGMARARARGVILGRFRAVPVEVVARIQAERAAGATLRAISDGLNRDDVPTAQGGRYWWPSTIRAVLRSRT